MARPRGVLLPLGVGFPPFLVEVGALPSRSRRGRKQERGRKERGAGPLPIRIGLGGRAPTLAASSSLVMHHPATNSLVPLLARLIVMCITERAQRYLSDNWSDKS